MSDNTIVPFGDGGELEITAVGGGWPPAFIKAVARYPGKDERRGLYPREGCRRPSVEECLITIRELRAGEGPKDERLRKMAEREVLLTLKDLMGGEDGEFVDVESVTTPLVDEDPDNAN